MRSRRCGMVFFSLTIARHGETEYNKNRLIQGQSDIPLSAEGRKQSLLLGRRLCDETFTHIYTSKLSRAIQTAECILENNNHDKPEIIRDERLAERKFGEMEGKPFKLMLEMAKKSRLAVGAFTPPGAETAAQVRQRAASFFEHLCNRLIAEDESRKNQDGKDKESHGRTCSTSVEEERPISVLVVSHGGFINEFVHHLIHDLKCKIPDGKLRALSKFSPNASVSKFAVRTKESGQLSISCLYFYDRQHLNDKPLSRE